MSHWIPVKTLDVVTYNGVLHVVKSVQVTPDGPLLDIAPVKLDSIIVHASQVKMSDSDEAAIRGKAVGYKSVDLDSDSLHANPGSVSLPANVSAVEAQRILSQLSQSKKRL